MEDRYITLNGKYFYFFSIFYAEKDWLNILPLINSFYMNNLTIFKDCILSFSHYQGEHIKVILSSENINIEETKRLIDHYFLYIIQKHPSLSLPSTPFPFGERMWMNYPNNTIEWCKFNFPNYMRLSTDLIRFMHYLSLLVIQLADLSDSIEEELISLSSFFMVNLCKSPYFDFQQIKAFLPTEKVSDEWIDIFDSYWDYIFVEDDVSCHFKKWQKTIDQIYQAGQFGFLDMAKLISENLNVSFFYTKTLMLIANWYQVKF